jgi:membrane fusion protein, multidrug efflux system
MNGNGLGGTGHELALRREQPRKNGAHWRNSSASEEQTTFYEQLGRPRVQVELRGDRQQALQRNPQPNNPDVADYVEGDEESEPSDPKNSAGRRGFLRKRPVILVLALVAVAVLCAVGMHFWNYLQSYQWTDDAEIDGHLDAVSTRINGTVVHVYVENTYHVKKGQPLVDLDPRDYQVAVENARANLAEAVQGVSAAQQSHDLSVANLAAAVATNAKAQVDVARYRQLLVQSVIARETYDEIVMVGKVDAATTNSDRAAVAAAEGVVGQARAAVQAAQASFDQAELNLSYTHIVAPSSGVVGDKTVQVGQRVQPGEQLLTIVPLNRIWITADFRETQVRRMHRGEPVTVHVDATGGDYKGYVEGLPGASGELFSLLPPENATGNYVKVVQRLPVRIRLYPGEDPTHRLRPGMSVEPTVWVSGGPRTFW